MGWSGAAAKKIAKSKTVHNWLAGDRLGKVTSPVLREMRIRASLGYPTEPETTEWLVELLEEILDAAADTEDAGSSLVAQEIPDLIRTLEKYRLDAVEENEVDRGRWEEKYDDLEATHASARKDLEAEALEHCKRIDELKARAEKAEREATEMRSSPSIIGAKNDPGEVDAWSRQVRALTQRVEDLEKQDALNTKTLAEVRKVRDDALLGLNEMLAAARVAIPEAEHPTKPSVDNWAWQIRALGEDRRAAYRQKSELEEALAHVRSIRPMRMRKKRS